MNLRVGLPVLAIVVIAGALVYRATRPPTFAEATAPLREEIRALRLASDSCQAALTQQNDSLDAYDDRLDSLRARVRAFEQMDPRGVPADSYESYLRTFDEYNRSVPGWSDRADALQEEWARCRAVTVQHNALTDSLRGLLAERAAEATGTAP